MPMRVVTQGAVRVGSATVARDYGDCLLVYVDMISKHAQVEYTNWGADEGPSVSLVADAATLNVYDQVMREKATCIEFQTLKGWQVFSATGPDRYTMTLTLIAPDT